MPHCSPSLPEHPPAHSRESASVSVPASENPVYRHQRPSPAVRSDPEIPSRKTVPDFPPQPLPFRILRFPAADHRAADLLPLHSGFRLPTEAEYSAVCFSPDLRPAKAPYTAAARSRSQRHLHPDPGLSDSLPLSVVSPHPPAAQIQASLPQTEERQTKRELFFLKPYVFSYFFLWAYR